MITEQIKQEIIKYIYNNTNMINFKYKIIKDMIDLENLRKSKFYVASNPNGIKAILIFKRIQNNNYAFYIDRKTLSCSINKINKINLMEIQIKLDSEVYDGTIFDGILTKTCNKTTFLITDVFYFRNKNMINENIFYKLMNIVAYLTQNYNYNPKQDNLEIMCQKLYELENIRVLLSDIEKNFKIRGLIFYPEFSQQTEKLIYFFNYVTTTQNNTINYKTTNNNLNNTEPKTNKTVNYETTNNNLNNTEPNTNKTDTNKIDTIDINKIELDLNKIFDKQVLTFKIKSSETDVYKLYLIFKYKNNDNKTIIKTIKIDIAYIPDIETSQMCQKLMLEQKSNNILMDCEFIKTRNKWKPIRVNTEKTYPSLINDYI